MRAEIRIASREWTAAMLSSGLSSGNRWSEKKLKSSCLLLVLWTELLLRMSQETDCLV